MATIEDVTLIWSSAGGVIDFLRDPKVGLSPEQFEAAASKLPEEHRKALTSSHLAWDRVPLVALNRLVEAAARIKGEPVEFFAKRAGRYSAEKSPIMKTFAILMTPGSVLKVAAQTWQKIYGCGTTTVEKTDRGAKMIVVGFPSEPVGCARVTGWLEVVTEAAGGKNVRIEHSECVTRKNERCVWDVLWD